MEQAQITQIIEALLFSSNHALNAKQISRILEIESSHQIKEAVRDLNHFYEESGRAFFIQEIAGGFLLTTKKEFQSWVQNAKVQKPISLSPSSMETLSIIAYKQPITRAEVDEIRGVDSSYAVRSMLDKGLLRILGKKEAPGRPMLYGTSKLFLEIFGFTNLKDLPRPEEFDLFEFDEEDGHTIEGQVEETTNEGADEKTELQEIEAPDSQALLAEMEELASGELANENNIAIEQDLEATNAENQEQTEENGED